MHSEQHNVMCNNSIHNILNPNRLVKKSNETVYITYLAETDEITYDYGGKACQKSYSKTAIYC